MTCRGAKRGRHLSCCIAITTEMIFWSKARSGWEEERYKCGRRSSPQEEYTSTIVLVPCTWQVCAVAMVLCVFVYERSLAWVCARMIVLRRFTCTEVWENDTQEDMLWVHKRRESEVVIACTSQHTADALCESPGHSHARMVALRCEVHQKTH